MTARLPASVEVSAVIRLAEASGGFGMVLRKGDPDSGTILLVVLDNQGFGRSLGRAYERLPSADGTRDWTLSKAQTTENQGDFEDYLTRRMAQDRDLWVVELTIAQADQFILKLGPMENKTGFTG